MEMENMGDRPGRTKRAAGGKLKPSAKSDESVHMYNAKGSPEAKEAMNKIPAFRHGGRAKRKDGGHAEGKMAHHRMDRGERVHRARGGGTPYSSGASLKGPTDDKNAQGHEGASAA